MSLEVWRNPDGVIYLKEPDRRVFTVLVLEPGWTKLGTIEVKDV